MGKSTIIEAQNSNTVFENGSNSGILGRLKGIFADYKHGTRNADRLYTEELWDNRVFGSEDVMEALETRTLFGELDHPEGDRCETLAKNAAISITKLEKRPEEGVIYGEADILDTPTGRIVKALADSGAKLGVSSRGMGEEVFVDGQNIIDPDTYDFITFDVVVTPANTKARVELTESKHLNKLTESIKREINDCETENQVNQLKTVVENVNVGNKDELDKLIETKLQSLQVKDIPVKLSEANKSIAIKLLKEKIEESKVQLDEALKTSADLAEENAKLVEKNNFLETSRVALKAKLSEAVKVEGKGADDVLFANACDDAYYGYGFNDFVKFERERGTAEGYTDDELKVIWDKAFNHMAKEENRKLRDESKVKLENATKTIEELNERIKTETDNHREMLLRARQIANRKVENTETTHNNKIAELNESLANKDAVINEKQARIDKLIESNKEKQNKLNMYARVLVENKKLKEENNKLQEASKLHQAKLTESKLQETKKIRDLEAKIKTLTENNQKMVETQDRFSKMAFDPLGTVKAVAENFNTGDYDQDDIDLFNMLTNKK